MCGIAGLVSQYGFSSEREDAVRRMVARQRSRGPDDEGSISNSSATLGMCRLAIIDPANGRQPMRTEDGRFHLVFNGAIYNHAELRAECRKRGARFRTQCDTEVLLQLLALEGTACLPKLRGMFAFLLWDAGECRLIAARDALGIKPLYHARLPGGGLILASEINAILASGRFETSIDPASVAQYLAWFSVPAPRTIYRGIWNLPPGHLLEADATGNAHTRRWWTLPVASPAGSEGGNYGQFVSGLRRQLEDTIRAHQVADVPVGAFLSGGLDSTAVVALMAATGAARLKTFSLVFDEKEYSEAAEARATAAALGCDHHEEKLTGSRVASDIGSIVDRLDQPTGDGINTYYVSRAARAGGVTVALSGLGGDELFGGYPSFRDLPRLARLLPAWRRIPQVLRAWIVDAVRNGGSTRARKLADFLAQARDLHELASLQRRVLSEPVRLSVLCDAAKRAALREGPHHPRLDDLVMDLAGADTFQMVSAWELRTYMTDVLLRDSDVFSMANSLELRVPFVDRPLVEWLWNQPRAFKDQPVRPKGALRDAVADLLPPASRQTPKRGFTLPFARWMKHELSEFLEWTYSGAALANCPWLDADATARLWRDFRSADDSRAWSRVWTVAILIAFANRSAA